MSAFFPVYGGTTRPQPDGHLIRSGAVRSCGFATWEKLSAISASNGHGEVGYSGFARYRSSWNRAPWHWTCSPSGCGFIDAMNPSHTLIALMPFTRPAASRIRYGATTSLWLVSGSMMYSLAPYSPVPGSNAG